MGLFKNMEKKNTDRTVDALKLLIPEQSPEAIEVPCHLVDETHVGIRLGDDAKGVLVLHRSQLKWWMRYVPAPDSLRLTGPLAKYTIVAEPASFLMPIGGPGETAAAIALKVSPFPSEWRVPYAALMDRERKQQLRRAAKLQYWLERDVPNATIELVDIPCLRREGTHIGFRVHLDDIEGGWVAGAVCEGNWIVSGWISPQWTTYNTSVLDERRDAGSLSQFVGGIRKAIYEALEREVGS